MGVLQRTFSGGDLLDSPSTSPFVLQRPLSGDDDVVQTDFFDLLHDPLFSELDAFNPPRTPPAYPQHLFASQPFGNSDWHGVLSDSFDVFDATFIPSAGTLQSATGQLSRQVSCIDPAELFAPPQLQFSLSHVKRASSENPFDKSSPGPLLVASQIQDLNDSSYIDAPHKYDESNIVVAPSDASPTQEQPQDCESSEDESGSVQVPVTGADEEEYIAPADPSDEEDCEYRPSGRAVAARRPRAARAKPRAGRAGRRKASAPYPSPTPSEEDSDRPFPCADCGLRFRRDAERVRHAVKHLPEALQNLVCGVCGRSVSGGRKDAMRRHHQRTRICLKKQAQYTDAELAQMGCITREEREQKKAALKSTD